MNKELQNEIEIYESLIRKGAERKYIDNQRDRVFEFVIEENEKETLKKIGIHIGKVKK